MMDPTRKPVFRRIVDDLKRQISDGTLRVHAALPSERSLAIDHNVSRMTARRALEALEAEGLAYNKDRQGRFVSPGRVNYDLNSMRDFVTLAARADPQIKVDLLKTRMTSAGVEIGQTFDIAVDTQVIENQRLFHRDDHTIFLETETTLPDVGRQFVPDADRLTEQQLREYRYGPLGQTADIVIRMRPLVPDEAELLGVTPYQLGIEQTQCVRDASGVPFCFCQQIWRGELAQFSATAMLHQRSSGTA